MQTYIGVAHSGKGLPEMSESKKVGIIYVGQRQLSTDKIAHAFMHNGEMRYWCKAKYVVIGHSYQADVFEADEQNPNGKITLATTPVDLGKADIEIEKLDEWRLSDKMAEQFAKRKRAHAAQLKRRPEIVAHAIVLIRMYRKLRTNEDRVAFEEITLKALRGYYDGQ